MTQEELEFNEKCAKFLEFIPKKYRQTDENIIWCDKKHGLPVGELKFHKDFNWTMEVVVAIEKLKYLVVIQSNFCQIQEIGSIENNFEPLIIASLYGNNKKDAVIQAIDKFLDWY